jgi:hypothetical protein
MRKFCPNLVCGRMPVSLKRCRRKESVWREVRGEVMEQGMEGDDGI